MRHCTNADSSTEGTTMSLPGDVRALCNDEETISNKQNKQIVHEALLTLE
jgi:hypothetical protein